MLAFGTLNPEQREAVQTIRGPVLILAGAGTGKTRVITYRTAWMLRQGVAPDQILAVTFTNKAAREMRERISKLVPKPARKGGSHRTVGPTICTFHSLGARILREHVERLGYKRNFVIYDDSERLSVVKKLLSHLHTGNSPADPAAAMAWISRMKNQGNVADASGPEGIVVLADRLRDRYASALRACNAVDFDDLLGMPLRLLEEHADVLAACRDRYRFVMVDEYQDTNAAQFRILDQLCREHRNLCVVGDDDQSIYSWRGAQTANLLDLERHYPEVRVIKLEQNYRSTSTILDAANAVIRHNPRRLGKNLWSEGGRGDPIEILEYESDEEEAKSVAERIEFERLSGRVSLGDQAILFRTNLQARPLELALRQAGIRYHLIGGQSYFDRREVRDVLAYLKVLVNPDDDVSLLRIANVPARGLSDATMEKLLGFSQERPGSVYAVMRQADVQASLPARPRQSLQRFLQWIEETRRALQSLQPLALSVWAEAFLKEIDYCGDLRRAEKNAEVSDNRVRNVRELIADLDRNVDSAIASPAERLERFLEEITLDSEREEEKESVPHAVTLITMHSCKGLEFPHVHVVGLEDGLLPHARSKEEGTLDEERRLFYVAMTRARRKLALSYCLSRKKYGQPMPCHPSPFLQELPAELLTHPLEKAKQPVNVDQGTNLFSAMRDALESSISKSRCK